MISIIAALSDNNVIGNNNKLPWHIPEDLQFFKNVTEGQVVIMGRKTLESIGKPLPNRANIVLTRKGVLHGMSFCGTDRCVTLGDALKHAKEHYKGKQIFIIGGGEIYRQALPLADRLILTRVPGEYEGDAYFPTFNTRNWRVESKFFTSTCTREVWKRKHERTETASEDNQVAGS